VSVHAERVPVAYCHRNVTETQATEYQKYTRVQHT